MAIRPKFPLPKGYFGPLNLTKEQDERYREIVRRKVELVLSDEHEFVVSRRRQVDTSKWKLVRSKHQLHVYRRRATTTAVLGDASKQPSMFCVGRMEGSLEDLIYGMYDKSHEEMKITMKYLDTTCRDSTVLHNVDLATASDPFHYLGFKYLVTKFPGVIKDRDWSYLEASGIEKDSAGQRYAYGMMHSVNLANVPAWDKADVVRGQLFFTFLFRESEAAGFVEVFAQGLFDPAGEMIQMISTIMTQETLMAVSKSVKCAEAKKLTILALATYTEKTLFAKGRCSVCTSTGGMFASLKSCRVCGAPVCNKCRLKKFIFAGPERSINNISCCPPCFLKSKTMDIRPADEAFSILAEKHLPEDLFRSENGSQSEAPTPRDTLYHDEDKSTICDSEDEGYPLSVCSGMSEDEIESTIEAMKRAKLSNQQLYRNDSLEYAPSSGYVGSARASSQHSGAGGHYPSSQGRSGYQSEFEFRNLNQQQQPDLYSLRAAPTPAPRSYGAPVPLDTYRSQQRTHQDYRGSGPADYRSVSPRQQYHTGASARPGAAVPAAPMPTDDYRSARSFQGDYHSTTPSHHHNQYREAPAPAPRANAAPVPTDSYRSGRGDYRGSGPTEYRRVSPSQHRSPVPLHVGGGSNSSFIAAPLPRQLDVGQQVELFNKLVARGFSAAEICSMAKANNIDIRAIEEHIRPH